LEPGLKPSERLVDDIYRSERGKEYLEEHVTLLHCTTQYPAPVEDANLLAIDLLREEFALPVGYSDHTEGVFASVAAAARGAVVIEKHFTLDKTLPGPDHRASASPEELAELVQKVRTVERLLGKKEKRIADSEMENAAIARKSLVALETISKGSVFSPANLGVKRPADGASPTKYWDYIGRISDRDYARDEPIR
jgi:N-acetylneuraminate synthase